MNITYRNLKLSLFALLVILFAITAAAEQKPGLDVTAAAGYQYDSNVSLAELDTNLGEADNATVLELALDGTLPVTDAVTIKLGYGYNQTSYAEFSEFDTAIHRLQGDLNWRVQGFDTGLALRHFAAQLDGERFLDIRQVSPNVARLVGNTLYLRGAFTASEKLYADRDERDASNNAFDVDAYWLLDGMQRYLAIGIRIDREDAQSDEFDYDGNRIKLSYGHELESLPLKLKARLQLENRDYVNVTESLGTERSDERFRAGLTATVPFAEYFSIEGEAEYADYRSNLASASFDEMLYSVSLRASF